MVWVFGNAGPYFEEVHLNQHLYVHILETRAAPFLNAFISWNCKVTCFDTRHNILGLFLWSALKHHSNDVPYDGREIKGKVQEAIN